MPTNKPRVYEAMFLLPSSVEPDAGIKLVTGVIQKHGGETLVVKKWDERKLTYEIKKHKRGLYVLAFFKAPPSALVILERDVRLSEEFVRLMITHADHLTVPEMEAIEPQPIIKEEPRFDMGFGGGYGGDRPPRDDNRPPRDGPGRDGPGRDGPRPARAPVGAEAGFDKD